MYTTFTKRQMTSARVFAVLRTARRGNLTGCHVCSRNRKSIIPALLCALVFFTSLANRTSACSTNPVSPRIASVADLDVSGWVAYGPGSPAPAAPGIYLSPLRQFKPQMIPNTGDGLYSPCDVSPDGKWILCARGSTAILIRTTGENKTTVPVSAKVFEGNVCFYRGSPYGLEIAYVNSANGSNVKAIRVNLSGIAPVFGAIRDIATGIAESGVAINGEMSVAHGKIFLRVNSHQLMLTIPDRGKGTATMATSYKGLYFNTGCGLTMSHDGKKTAANFGSNLVNELCAPREHRGLIVWPFPDSDPKMGPMQFLEQKGLAVNFAPHFDPKKDAPFTSRRLMEYHQWYWTNSDKYIVGVEQGDKPVEWGIWLNDWRSNTWYFLTPPGTKCSQPVAFISGPGLELHPESQVQRSRSTPRHSKFNVTRYGSASAVDLTGRSGQLPARPRFGAFVETDKH